MPRVIPTATRTAISAGALATLAVAATAVTGNAAPPPAGKHPAAAADPPACTLYVADPAEAADADVRPGDVVCFPATLDSDDRLVVTTGGTADAPVTYRGRGAAVGGIDVEADHVEVRDFTLERPEAPGVWLEGDGNTLRNVTITEPRGGDGDGIRFFGDDLRILDNTVTGTDNSTGAHADCMQTYASDSPPSRRVLIQGNRCEDIDNMGLMAEGPNDGEGDGVGTTSHFTIRDNYFETLEASQALMFEDVQDVTIVGNHFAAPTHHAIGLAVGSTGAYVGDNTYHPGIGYLVGIDDSSLPGYDGPAPGGQP